MKRLFENYTEVETEYYKKTKIFSIRHTVVIKEEIYRDNPWPYGVEKNMETLEAVTQYSYEQGLSKRKLGVEELFAKETLNS